MYKVWYTLTNHEALVYFISNLEKKTKKFYVDSFNQTHSLPHAHTRAKTPTKNEL